MHCLAGAAWRRLNDIEIVYDALSSGINEPAYNLSFKFLEGSGGRAEHWAPIKCI